MMVVGLNKATAAALFMAVFAPRLRTYERVIQMP